MWSPHTFLYTYGLPTNDPDFFWIGPHPDFCPFVHSFGLDIQQNLGSNLYTLGLDILQHIPGACLNLFNLYVALSHSGQSTIRLLCDFDPNVFKQEHGIALLSEDERVEQLNQETRMVAKDG